MAVQHGGVAYLELPRESRKTSQLYKITNSFLSRMTERNLNVINCLRLCKDVANVKEVKRKLTQYKILHCYYHTPLRLNRIKLVKNTFVLLCCKTTKGTFLYSTKDCGLVRPLTGIQVLEILS